MSTTEAVVNQRKVLRTAPRDAYIKTHTVAVMLAIAVELKFEIPEGIKSKPDIYDAMIKAANFPDQSLRGSSTVGSPVAYVWRRCDAIWAEAGDPEVEGYTAPRRKDVMVLLKSEGVAHHTARTQIQSWIKATAGADGRRRLADMPNTDLPKSLQVVVEQGDA